MSLWSDDHLPQISNTQKIISYIISTILFALFWLFIGMILIALHPFMIGFYICLASGDCVIVK